jgi:hypothetical protein
VAVKAVVLFHYDEKLTGSDFVRYVDIPTPENPQIIRCERAHRRAGSVAPIFTLWKEFAAARST